MAKGKREDDIGGARGGMVQIIPSNKHFSFFLLLDSASFGGST